MYQYFDDEQKPRLEKTGTLMPGVIISIITIFFYMIMIIISMIQFGGAYNHTISIGLITIIGLLYIGVLALFVPYVDNFRLQTVKMLLIAIILLHFISVLMTLAFYVLNTIMMQDENMSVSTWASITNAIYTVFNIIFWVTCIALGAVMLGSKSDYVGGIRAIGGVIIAMTIGGIFIHFFRMLALPQILMSADIEDMKFAHSVVSVVTMLLNVVIIAAFLFVYMRALQYKRVNG
jgi:hypothetical protein